MNDSYDFEFALALLKEKLYSQLWKYALPHANAGDSNARCLVSFMWQSGFGVSPDLDEAERWLLEAAEQDNAIAWKNLGTLFVIRGEQDEAKRCYQKAVQLGFTVASALADG